MTDHRLVDTGVENCYVYEFPAAGTRPPRLDFVRSFIVYSNVGEYIETGGTLTPHLASFAVNAEPGTQVSYVANPPTFVPISQSYIDSIYIQLNDEHGKPPPFSTNHLNSVCVKLRFRNSKAGSSEA